MQRTPHTCTTPPQPSTDEDVGGLYMAIDTSTLEGMSTWRDQVPIRQCRSEPAFNYGALIGEIVLCTIVYS